jgi:hypothetical protein
VDSAIDLDDQSKLAAKEVDDVLIEDVLPPDLESTKTVPAKNLPQLTLRIRAFMAESFRESLEWPAALVSHEPRLPRLGPSPPTPLPASRGEGSRFARKPTPSPRLRGEGRGEGRLADIGTNERGARERVRAMLLSTA